MKTLYKSSGHQRKPTTFLFTESEIKDEVFLEYLNSILLTGDLPGLFAKDEIMAITSDLRNLFFFTQFYFINLRINLIFFILIKAYYFIVLFKIFYKEFPILF